jgi:hypothetical protein
MASALKVLGKTIDPAVGAGSTASALFIRGGGLRNVVAANREISSDEGGSVVRKRSHQVEVGEARCILEATELSRSGSMVASVTEVLILSRTMRQGKLAM